MPISDVFENMYRTVIRADGTKERISVPNIKEHRLTVFVDGKEAFSIICSKDCMNELVAGSLFLRGYIKEKENIAELRFDESEERADVTLRGDEDRSAGLVRNADENRPEGLVRNADGDRPEGLVRNADGDRHAGLARNADVDKQPGLTDDIISETDNTGFGQKKAEKTLPDTDSIFKLAKIFSEGMPVHSETQGTHSCILADGNSVLFTCEDIGRHNTVDKAVGYALMKDIDLSECILYISGRVPTDMIQKVIYSGIPVLVSKAVPTAEAVKMARENGVTLVVKAYPDRIEICE